MVLLHSRLLWVLDMYTIYCEHSFISYVVSGGIARFPCYPQFELEIHIVEVSYFTNILIKLSGL